MQVGEFTPREHRGQVPMMCSWSTIPGYDGLPPLPSGTKYTCGGRPPHPRAQLLSHSTVLGYRSPTRESSRATRVAFRLLDQAWFRPTAMPGIQRSPTVVATSAPDGTYRVEMGAGAVGKRSIVFPAEDDGNDTDDKVTLICCLTMLVGAYIVTCQ